MSESYKRITETPDEKMSRELVRLIDAEGYTEEEIREAYYQLCGVSEQVEVSEGVAELRAHMEEMTKAGYPLNRLSAVVAAVGNYESAIPEFERFVADMNVSEKEKSVLLSIVNETRSGKLECHADGVVTAVISIEGMGSPAALARILKGKINEVLKKSAGKKLSFWFEEK